jgi:nucleoside-diphosphate-sugar epimerase
MIFFDNVYAIGGDNVKHITEESLISLCSKKGWVNLFAKEMNASNKYQVLPNWLLKVLGLFIPIMKELPEMNYQYDRDYYFDSSKFNKRFNYTPTKNAIAVKQTVEQMTKKNGSV